MSDNDYQLACSIRNTLIQKGEIDKWEGDVMDIFKRPDVKTVMDNLKMLCESILGNDEKLLDMLAKPDTNVNCVKFYFGRDGDSCIEEIYRMCGSNPRVGEIIMNHPSFDPNLPDVVTLYPNGGDGIKMSILEFLVYMLSNKYCDDPTDDELKLLKLVVTHHKTTKATINACLDRDYKMSQNTDDEWYNERTTKFDLKEYIREIVFSS